MAFENSEPKTGVIVQIGILGIVGVLVVRFALIPYFDKTVDRLRYERIGHPASAEWHKVRDAELAKLNDGANSIEHAKSQLVLVGRKGYSPALEPTPSTDYSALQGWSNARWQQMNPGAIPSTFVPADAVPTTVADGGISDAAAKSALADAGPVKAAPAAKGNPAPNPPASTTVPGHK